MVMMGKFYADKLDSYILWSMTFIAVAPANRSLPPKQMGLGEWED